MRFAKFIPILTLALLIGGVAHAQTTTTSTSTTPGAPNTGAGGAAGENALILTGAGATALLSVTYLLRTRSR